MKLKGKKTVAKKVKKTIATKKQPKAPKATSSTVAQKNYSQPIIRLGLWEYNVKSRKIRWSSHVELFLTFKSEMPSTLSAFQKFIHRDNLQSFKTTLSNSIKKQIDFFSELRILRQDGVLQWIELTASPVLDARGKISKYSGMVRDITRKKETEIELANWRIKNELITESTGLILYDYDIGTGSIEWNGNLNKVVGFSSVELNTIEKWGSLIHPDDRQDVFDQLEKIKNELTAYEIHYRFQVKNREYCHIQDRGLVLTNDRGQPSRMLGFMSDITDQLSAMNEIGQSEKSYRELFNSVGEAIYITDIDGVLLDINDEGCRMYGYMKEELIGKNPDFLSLPDRNDYEKLMTQTALVLKGDQQIFPWWGVRKTGEVILLEVRLTKGTYFGKDTLIATAWDITEKFKIESSLLESEKRFQRMIEDLTIGVVFLGWNEEVLSANKTAKEILQLGESKTGMGENVYFITESGDSLLRMDLPWKVAIRTKSIVRGVLLGVKTKDERISWFLVNADPTFYEQEIQHVMITLTDITGRKQMEEHWQESELRFRTLQEASFGGIGLHRMGVIYDCNQGLANLTGYHHDELIGMNGLNLIAPEFRDEVIDKIVNKYPDPYDVVGLRKDGTRFFLEIHGKNIPYRDAQLRVTEFRDITDRKLTEEKILEQNAKLLVVTEDLKRKNEQLQEFTQIVSHNLRSPVGNILSLLSLIDNARDDEERNDAVALLKEAGSGTLATLTELNQVLQIQQSRNIEKQELYFSDVFNNVRQLLNAKIAESKAKIQTEFDSAPKVLFPKIYLESILLNLLSNALKYAHPTRSPEIIIKSVLNNDDSISLLVSDNGSGLDMKKYGHQVFKLRKTFHKHPESKGIGLFMIKAQIEAMGGRISLTSIENEGSVFQIDFNKT